MNQIALRTIRPNAPAMKLSVDALLTIQTPTSAPQSKSAQVIFRHLRNLFISHHLL